MMRFEKGNNLRTLSKLGKGAWHKNTYQQKVCSAVDVVSSFSLKITVLKNKRRKL